MKRFKKPLSILLSISLSLCIVGCNDEKKTESESGNSWREPAEVEVTEQFVDTDGDFEYKTVDFSVAEGYVIVYPDKNTNALQAANILKEYYKSACKVDLAVVSDKTAEAEKEILIGKTNRKQSSNDLKETDLKVSLEGKKLVFSAGHDVILKSAIEKFVRLPFEAGKAHTFELTTDFKQTMLDGYEYVWGDEFEGIDIDFTKWDFEDRMGTTPKIQVSWEKDVIDVGDGRLKLHAINYFDPMQQATRYKVPYSVLTKYKMNYKYGYAEIRARVPFYQGAWPSFWGLSIGGQGGYKADGGVCYNAEESAKRKYGVEIDIFEVFGSTSVLKPNAHKWYRPNNLDYDKMFGTSTDNHTQLPGKSVWDWSKKNVDLKNISNEYHTYGFEWTEKEMNFFVDGEKYYTLDIINSYDLLNDMEGFHKPIFLMFNNHVFADDMEWYENLIDDHTAMPFCYYIDYLRVYQKPNVGELHLDSTINSYVGR